MKFDWTVASKMCTVALHFGSDICQIKLGFVQVSFKSKYGKCPTAISCSDNMGKFHRHTRVCVCAHVHMHITLPKLI